MGSRLARIGAAALAVALFGFLAIGKFLYEAFIGLDWNAYPGGALIEKFFRLFYHGNNAISGVFYMVLGLALVIAASVWLTLRATRGGDADPLRRGLLSTGAGLGAVLIAGGAAFLRALAFGPGGKGWDQVQQGIVSAKVETTHPAYPEEWKGARVVGHRRFGRTEWQISDIVVGSGRIRDQKGTDIVRLALERGVNYVDTAPDYSATGSEEAVGAAIQGKREQVFLATKFCTPWGHLGAGTAVADYKRIVEDSLRRLRTDYVDLVHVHSCDEVNRLMDPNMHEAFDQLKQEGKARFLGFSSHTPNLEQVAARAIESNRFDVMMLAYHHGIWPSLGDLIHRARTERDMGIVAMKTLKGAKHNGLAGFRENAQAYSQAAFKWVLTNPDVACLVVSFFELQHLDEYIFASGSALATRDHALLQRYDEAIAGTYCPPHCGACLTHCSEDLAVNDVLRYRMYFEDYGLEKRGIQQYLQLGKNASACLGCAAPCTGQCPVGIPIQQRMLESHELLTVS